ncbi:hypothetical protein [Arcobacter sp. s6]
MRNVLIIRIIVISMGYMFSILFDKYNAAVETQNQNKLEQKQ